MQLLLWARLSIMAGKLTRTELDDKLEADGILGSDPIADNQIVPAS